METKASNKVAIGVESITSVEQSRSKGRWWTLPWLPQAWPPKKWRTPVLAAAGVLLAMLLVLIVQYLRLARMADRRLGEGPFSTSTEILSAPETIAPGTRSP